MIRHVIIHILAVTGLLVWGSCIPASARTFKQNDSWGYSSSYTATVNRSASAYSQMPSASRGYTPAYNSISAYDPSFKDGAKASTFFQYTPADALLSDNSSNGIQRGLRRGSIWDDPEDEPMGSIPTVPVGEPMVLLLLALLYCVGLCLRSRFSRQTPQSECPEI